MKLVYDYVEEVINPMPEAEDTTEENAYVV